jgi:diguanylate cyclase (GGDEF)-like protein
MRDPSSARDIRPRAGSPLWSYLTAVTAAGAVAAGLAVWRLTATGLTTLAGEPLPWVIAALALAGEVQPIVTRGKSGAGTGNASLTFCFAALLYWGFPVAALVRLLVTGIGAAVTRTSPLRAAFSAARDTLGLAAAGTVLATAGIHPRPLLPWLPGGGQLAAVGLAAAAYFVVSFCLSAVAAAMHARSPVAATLRRELPYQAFIGLVLLSAAPLVVVVMGRSVLLVLLFLLPLAALYANAAVSVQREHQALHDELTGLPNRVFLLRRAAEAVAEAGRSGLRAGFLLLDLDRFKEVNDTLGHHVGDCLLQMVARRLAHAVRPGDVVARLGGDEFAVLLPALGERGAAAEVAARLQAVLSRPFHLHGESFEIEASVGIALCPDDGSSVELLMQRADVAMYLAKERRTGVESYAREADRHSAARLSLLGELRRGLDLGEVELYYQPKVSLAGAGSYGMEALLRWRHPRRGLLTPAEFLPVAEQSYLMPDLTRYVLDAALGQAARWRASGLRAQVSLNLAARDLMDSGLAGLVGAMLARYCLAATDVMLEISERVLAGEPSHAAATVTALAARGVPISLDDFGTGHSSLVALKRLPVSEIKIDASLVAGLPEAPENELLVASVVRFARALGIRPVAEGVETAQVAAALAAMGCEAAQGRYFCPPLDAAAATEWLASEQRAAVTPGAAPAAAGPASPGRPLRAGHSR